MPEGPLVVGRRNGLAQRQGAWSGSPVFGALTKGHSSRIVQPVRERGSIHDGVEQERGDILGAIVRGLRAADRHEQRHGRVDLPVLLR